MAVFSCLSRAAGGGLGAKHLDKFKATWLPEALIGIGIGAATYVAWDVWWLSALATAWSYIWFQTGHGTAFHMGREPWVAQGKRKQTLSLVVDPICKTLGWTLGETKYCTLFMSLKGFLVGLPLGPFALLTGLMWPVGYGVKDTEAGEWISGAAIGLATALLLITFA